MYPFREILIKWGSENFRSYPWRFTNIPYHILIAEVMLHRTQAPQVLPVYERFIDKYPDVISLVKSRGKNFTAYYTLWDYAGELT